MTRWTLIQAALPAFCAAALILIPIAAGAQQVLVPTQPAARPVPVVRPAQPVAPDWFESNRALEVIRAQQRVQPASRSPSGLGSGEAARVYQNFLLGIGAPPLGSDSKDFGSGRGSGYGGSQ
ncbi:hypothetical protein [Inquilinus sp.]|jgi:hypothetical protein|uniref:hypothetical protein n=1 Tax=Inquilinus sp. TaxID=1932117 RepID=UPI0037831D86